MSGIHAARVAARIRNELGVDVDMVHGGYAEFKVLVDGQPLVQGGPLTFMGVMPSGRAIVQAVRARLAS